MKKFKSLLVLGLSFVFALGGGIIASLNTQSNYTVNAATNVNATEYTSANAMLATDWKNVFGTALSGITTLQFVSDFAGEVATHTTGLGNNVEALLSGTTLSLRATDGGEIYTPQNSNNLFNISKIVNINFNDLINTTETTDMSYMFVGSPTTADNLLKSLDVSSFNTTNVTTMERMFYNVRALTSLDVSSFNTPNLTNMAFMFANLLVATSINLGDNFDISKVTTMDRAFINCQKLVSLEFSKGFKTESLNNMYSTFAWNFSLTSLDLSVFDTSKVTDFGGLFQGLQRIETLDMSTFSFESATSTASMFSQAYSASVIHTPYNMAGVSIALPFNTSVKSYTNISGVGPTTFNALNYGTQGIVGVLDSKTVVVDFVLDGFTTGEMESITAYVDDNNKINFTISNEEAALISKQGFNLVGFNTELDGTGTTVRPNVPASLTYNNLNNIKLYPQFSLKPLALRGTEVADEYAVKAKFSSTGTDFVGYIVSLDTNIRLEATYEGGATGANLINIEYSTDQVNWQVLPVSNSAYDFINDKQVNIDVAEFLTEEFVVNNVSGDRLHFRANFDDTNSLLNVAGTVNLQNVGTVELTTGSSAQVFEDSFVTSYLNGTVVNITITPIKHYTIDSVFVNGINQVTGSYVAGSGLVLDNILVDKAIIVEVNYAKTQYNIIVNAVSIDPITGVKTNLNSYGLLTTTAGVQGQTITFDGTLPNISAITTSYAYIFAGWNYGNNTYFSDSVSLNGLSIDASKVVNNIITIEAVFEQKGFVSFDFAGIAADFRVTYINSENTNVTENSTEQNPITNIQTSTRGTVVVEVSVPAGYMLNQNALNELNLINAIVDANSVRFTPSGDDNIVFAFTPLNFVIEVTYINEQNGSVIPGVYNNHTITVNNAAFNTDSSVASFGDSVNAALVQNSSIDGYNFKGIYVVKGNNAFTLVDSALNSVSYVINDLSYSTAIANENVIQINVVYAQLTGLQTNFVQGENNSMGTIELSYENENGEFVAVNNLTNFENGTKFKITATANKYYEITEYSGFIGASLSKDGEELEFTLTGDLVTVNVVFAPVVYSVKMQNAETANGHVATQISGLYIGQQVTLFFESSSSHDVSSWSIANANVKTDGNSVTFTVTEEFLNAALKGNEIVLDHSIATTMDGAVLGGIIGGSVGFVVLAVLITLLILRNRKQNQEKLRLEKQVAEFNKKFNISDTINDLKKGKK